MKASVWNILSVAFLIGTVFLVVIFGIIFLMPNQVLPASLRPVQVPDKLLLPTPTETAFQFPPTWTKSPLPVTPSKTLEPTATTKPSETVKPSDTLDPNATVDPNATATPDLSPTVSVSAAVTSSGKSPTIAKSITATYTSTVKIVIPGNKSPTFTKTKKPTKTPTIAPTYTPGGPSAFRAIDDYATVGLYPDSVTLDVLANDDNLTGTPLRIVKITKGPYHGRVEVATDNATVTYWPNDGFSGTDSFYYKMTNPGGLTDYAWVYIAVSSSVMHAPTDISLSDNTFHENYPVGGSSAEFGQFSASDADGGTMTYTLVTGNGSGGNASFLLSSSGLLTAKTSFDREDQAVYEIRVRVTDNTGLFYEEPFDIYIEDVNEPPLITSPTSCNAVIGVEVTCQFRATENDSGDSVTFSLVPSAPSSWPAFMGSLVISGNTASFTGTPTVGSQGTYTFALTATDTGGLTDTQTFKLIVEVE